MIVSWNWLKDYLPLASHSPDEVALRLAMSGLNHEGTDIVGDDLAIDLEVPSNRPDCLGHLGVAREIAVIYELDQTFPNSQPAECSTPVDQLLKVRIDCPAMCPRYTARVVRGVRVAPSPDWLARRLTTLGIGVVNNIVDISNYVMMECGQPLHTFDYAKLSGGEIIVRGGKARETIEAIDHHTYQLDKDTCVIADPRQAVAIAGVMGGAATEISETTTDILIEAADFNPLVTRNTARRLRLQSPSSYRFERSVDPDGIDWASRRCCELILEFSGGELAKGVVDVVAEPVPTRKAIVLRLSQISRILGIDVPAATVERILTALGNEQVVSVDDEKAKQVITLRPPSWRRDLQREIDLIEEVGRIHGYDKIPEDVGVPMVSSHRTELDRIFEQIRHAMTASGFDEAMTASVVSNAWSTAFSPWTDSAALQSSTPMLRGADQLRRSMVPSLLGARQVNEAAGNTEIELFETAKIYLPHSSGLQSSGLPSEPWMLALTSGRDFLTIKGVIEGLVSHLNHAALMETADFSDPLLKRDACCALKLGGAVFGYLGEITPQVAKQFGLRGRTTVAELQLQPLREVACLVPQFEPESVFPAIRRDLNLIVDESVRWGFLAQTVRQVCGDLLERLDYLETYRAADKDGEGKKRLLFSFSLRSRTRTLTGDEADDLRDEVVEACRQQCEAELLA